jgi:hypothetical protein
MRRGKFARNLCLLCGLEANREGVQEEKDRMDIYHKIMEVARRGQLHSAPIYVNPHDPPRILDLGCGTGIWAIDMAE